MAVRQRYATALEAESRLLTGTEYVDYTKPRTKGNQFLLPDTARVSPVMSTIVYQDITYSNVPLLYDIRFDQVVLADTSGGPRIQLLANNIEQFTMADRQFVRFVPDSAALALLPTGFYEVLLAGRASVLVRRTKKIVDESSMQKISYRYQTENRLFARQGTSAVSVTNLKSLLRLLPDHKAELSKYARSNRLSFGKDQREASAVALLGYYNTLAP